MQPIGSLTWGGAVLKRKFRIGATLIKDQIAIWDGINGPGEITNPTANGFANAIGITYEAGTYATTSPHVFVTCTYDPFVIFKGRVSGGTTNNTAFTTANLQTQATASTTVLSDTLVGTLDYSGGYLVGLTGANKGHTRVLATQIDSTSCTVTVAFASSVAVGDTLLRTYAPFIRTVEITGTWDQFNNLITGTEAIGDAGMGPAMILQVFVDGQDLSIANFVGIQNPTAPIVDFAATFTDHALARHTA